MRTLKGKELVGKSYEPLFEDRGENAHKVWHADYVSLEDGTGLVHLAPAYGEEDDTSQFGHEPPFRPRRNPLKMWTYAGIVFCVVVMALIVAVSRWGLPAWVPVNRPTFAAAQADLQLDFPAAQQERRQLPDGTEYFGASGTITNTGSTARNVPPILIVLRDAQDRIVYSWEVYPPKRTLAPGESETVNQAVTDVPRSAKVAEIGWKPSY